ncbi:MAG: hypothetical protein D6689_19555 [Deltaproteobacteria bacterium]|nr:MAG: hypothetical protein D6689_19555 [Deltaproteobacteria bacterium]
MDPADDIEQALEQDNGGLTMDDELPMFGEADAFAAADEDAVDAPVADALESDPDVVAMREAPDAALYGVTIVWGQMPVDPDETQPRNWSGAIRINRGALLVRSTIRFEDGTDRLLPRDNPREVRFTSATRPARDGLRLAIIDPEPRSDEPLVIAYETADGELFSAPVAALVDGPIVEDVDDRGNRVVAVAIRRPVDVCEHGFLAGRWHKIGERFGVLRGRVTDVDGNVLGHMRGLYGVRRNGEKVFFGKYINRDGAFRGLFAGHYGDGLFAGRWLTRAGEHGRLGGHYRETLPGPRVGGHYLGRWAETSCGIDVGPGRDVPGETD